MSFMGMLLVMVWIFLTGFSWSAEVDIVAEEWFAANRTQKFLLANAVPVPGALPVSEEDVPITLQGRFQLFEALKLVADMSKKNLVIGEGVKDRDISLYLKAVPLRRALSIVLYSDGYGVRFEGNDLLVLARETRVFSLSLPPVIQRGESLTSNESRVGAVDSGSGISGQRVRVGAGVLLENKSRDISYWDDVQKNIQSLLSPGGDCSFNRSAGLAVVSDTPVVLDKVALFMRELNKRAAGQIFVDIKLIEVELSNEYKLGIDWSVLARRGDLRSLGAAENFASENITGGNYLTLSGAFFSDKTGSDSSVLVRALDTFGRVEVVSQPRISMLNNTLAGIQVGETRSYIDSSGIATTQSGGTVSSVTLGEVHGGVTLQLIGNIIGDEVYMNVTPVVSMIDDIRSVSLGQGARVEAPETSVKSMTTMVRLRFGQTAVIGGLITKNNFKKHYGIPLLGRIPVLGRLFSYDTRRRTRSELVILIAPKRSGL